MTYYRYDFDADSIGSTTPTGFTKRWVTAGATYEVVANANAPKGKALKITRSSAMRSFISSDSPSSDVDRNIIKQRVLVKLPQLTDYVENSGYRMTWLTARASGVAASETGYAPGLLRNVANQYVFSWLEYQSGASSQSDAGTINQYSAGNTYWLVLEINGSSQTISLYASNDYDFSTPLVTSTRTDTDITADGWVGFGGFTQVGGAGEQILLYDVATGADVLPDITPEGAPSITSITPGATSAEVAYSTTGVWAGTSYEYRVNGGTPAALGASPATISGLSPSTAYNSPGLEIRAINEAGAGSWSTAQSFTTTSGGSTTKGVRITLYAKSGSLQADLSNLDVAFFDQTSVSSLLAPVFTSAVEGTNGSGLLELNVDAETSLSLGQNGLIICCKKHPTDPKLDQYYIGEAQITDIT